MDDGDSDAHPRHEEGRKFERFAFVLVFQISKLWSMSREIGCTLEIKHVIVTNAVDDVFPMQID